jgi:hypothetical protein
MESKPHAMWRIWEKTEPKWSVAWTVFLSAMYTPTMTIFATLMAQNVFIMVVPPEEVKYVRTDAVGKDGYTFIVDKTYQFLYWMLGLSVVTFISRFGI